MRAEGEREGRRRGEGREEDKEEWKVRRREEREDYAYQILRGHIPSRYRWVVIGSKC